MDSGNVCALVLIMIICVVTIIFFIFLAAKSSIDDRRDRDRYQREYEREAEELEEHFRNGRISESTYLERRRMIERKYDRLLGNSNYEPYNRY